MVRELWRADDFHTAIGTTGSDAYAGAPMKYFATEKEEIQSYVRTKKSPFQKRWEVTANLNLLDILNPTKREELYVGAPSDVKASLDIAFPKDSSGKPYRVSKPETTNHDYAVLSYICEKGYDGYYMAKQEQNLNIEEFHSEVGLCGSALSKLTLAEELKETAQGIEKKRRRTEYPDSPPGSPVRKGALFGGRKKKNTRRKKKFSKTRRRARNGGLLSV